MNIKAIARRKPVYCAITVPKAIPLNPMGVYNAKYTLAPKLTTFTVISVIIGITVFCIPIKNPLKTNSERVAGAAHILMKKYCLTYFSASGEQSIRLSAMSTYHHCIIQKKRENPKAVIIPWLKTLIASLKLFAPKA